MKRPIVFAVAVVAQLGVLAAMTIPQARNVRSGSRVLLPVVPVDPNDLFRGEYVRLGYHISRINPALWRGPRVAAGEDVWVRLDLQGDKWVPEVEQAARGPEAAGSVWLRGKRGKDSESVTYGIEEFFVRQGRGPKIEESVRSGQVFAEFAVGPDGRATLTALIAAGERIE